MVAAQFPCHSQVCYDDDMDVEDPTCMAYDMSEASSRDEQREEEQRGIVAVQDPIGFYEQEFARYVEVSKGLLEPLCCKVLLELTKTRENGDNRVEIRHEKNWKAAGSQLS